MGRRGRDLLRIGAVGLALLVAGSVGRGPAPSASRGRGITPRAKASMAFLFAGTARPVRDRGSVAEGWAPQALWGRSVDWEPIVAADRSSGNVYQMAVRYGPRDCPGCPDPVIVFRSSEDSGSTWGPDRYPFRDGRTHADPRLAVAADGTIFAAFLQDHVPGAVVARSRDGGRTWSEPVPVSGDRRPTWSDYPQLLVSDDARHVYVAFNAGDSYVAASHDGGRTFARPVRTNEDSRTWFHTGGVVLGDGTVLVAAIDYSRSYRGRAGINILRSTDDGATWKTRRVGRSREAPACPGIPGCYLGFLGPSAALAVEPGGRIMLVFNAGVRDGRPPGLWYRTSSDGRSWTPRARVVGGGNGVTHVFPVVVGGGAEGEFRVLWQDDRRGAWNTWFRHTTDGGQSWSRRARLSAEGPLASYQQSAGYSFPYGDYFGAAVGGDGRTHVIWGAGESWSGRGGAWYTRSEPATR